MIPYIKMFSLVLLSTVLINGQPNNIEFECYKDQQGLSANSILCVMQDSRGFLWIGTTYGLNRYDGYNFKTYKFNPDDPASLSGNNIFAICEDITGDLWIGTNNSGLNIYNRDCDNFVRYFNIPDDSTSLSSDRISSICINNNGDCFIGTTGGGLNKFVREKNNFVRFYHNHNESTSLSSNNITCLYNDMKGVLWIGTSDGGLDKIQSASDNTVGGKESTSTFVHYRHDPKNPTSISSDIICSIFEDKNGTLWIGTYEGGLNKFIKERGQFLHYKNDPGDPISLSDNSVYSICEDRQGRLWIGTYSGGLNLYNRASEKFTRFINIPGESTSLSDNSVMSICEDEGGILWFGTFNGLNKYYERKKISTYRHIPDNLNSLSSDLVYSICEDKFGNLWIGTEDGGLNKFNRAKNEFTHFLFNDGFNGISSNTVYSLFEDKSGTLWIGTGGGGLDKVVLRDGRNITPEFINYNNNPLDTMSLSCDYVSYIYEDRNSILWIGTYGGGLNRFNRTNEEFTRFLNNPDDPNSLSSNLIFSICEDKTGNLWIGTYGGGLNRFTPETPDSASVNKISISKFIHYQNDPDKSSSLSSDNISSIYEDKSGVLWIGTYNGLNKFDEQNNSFIKYYESDGLANDMIYGIQEDNKGNLWISTNKGLSKFNTQTCVFINYDITDGLQGNEFNQWASYKNKKGEMFFGGSHGVNVFHPDSIKDNHNIPRIIITDFQLQHKPVIVGYDETKDRTILNHSITDTREIEFLHDDNVISFEFCAVDFQSPQTNKYAYMLEGFNNDWTVTDASKRFVTYTNLDPGEYTFKVKGSNNDGIWNEAGTSIKLIILPPWWSRWWAYSLYGIILILIAISLRFYDLKRQRLKHQLVLEHEHAEKLEEIDRMKSRFFANISHEFRTPLTLILGPIDTIIQKLHDDDSKKQAGVVKRNALRLLRLINQLLDLSKLDAGKLKLEASPGNIVTFVKGIAMSFESIAECKDIIFRVKSELDKIELYFDHDKLDKVFTNILSNAFKFTPIGGDITITV